MDTHDSFRNSCLSLTDTFRSECFGGEIETLSSQLSLVSLDATSQKLLDVCRASHELHLVDPAQVMAEGRTAEEVQPFIRALGVSAEDLWAHYYPSKVDLQNDIQEAQQALISKLQGTIEATYRQVGQMLSTKKPREAVSQLQNAMACHKADKIRLQAKKAALLQAISKTSHLCAADLSHTLQVLSSNSENRAVSSDEVALENIKLKFELTYNEIWQGIYNERTLPALEEIYSELVQMLDEQLDMRAQLRSKLQKYESSSRLKEVLAEYSKVRRQIEAKRRDIAALGS
mmetsp:Transcript_34315/g.60065  ORF Transcript_34315/g.60065 Transcript_34315/m.60065 type:complete len:288 (-) Transcript_34315:2430-3293(-)